MKYIEIESVIHRDEQIHIIYSYNGVEYIHSLDSMLTGVITHDKLYDYLVKKSCEPDNVCVSQLYYDAAQMVATGKSRGSWVRDDNDFIEYKEEYL